MLPEIKMVRVKAIKKKRIYIYLQCVPTAAVVLLQWLWTLQGCSDLASTGPFIRKTTLWQVDERAWHYINTERMWVCQNYICKHENRILLNFKKLVTGYNFSNVQMQWSFFYATLQLNCFKKFALKQTKLLPLRTT